MIVQVQVNHLDDEILENWYSYKMIFIIRGGKVFYSTIVLDQRQK